MLNDELQKIANILNEGIIQELHLQGHTLLEELESTIRSNVKIRNQKNIAIVEGGAVAYIQKMEWGTRIFELGSKVNHLKVLYNFYSRLGFDSKQAFIRAKRLLPHHFREGVPTDFSKIYSKTGERKQFIQAAWRKKEKEVDVIMDKTMDDVFLNEFNIQKSEII